ncbi:hypothetical protein KCG43_13450 [Photobacterium sp. WH24]|uniref:two-partner secretion domain-containing protein n=1 Tax=Photobacterium sp. WH24 TaxID=2827237 RepID=UPI001C47846D|nr:hypothetical protein [Photobacterium sp. WH24]MBV7263004.1 hypothetical protein [Photobacterium sp. WH24]
MIRKFNSKWAAIMLLTSTLSLPHLAFASLTSQNTKVVTSKGTEASESETLIFMGRLSSDGTAHVQVGTDGRTVKRLLLVNNPILNKGVKSKPAQVTVIHNMSTKPLAIGQVEVLGPSSDVIIASPSGVICDSCEFKNAKRIVLATGSPIFNHGNLASIKTQQGLLEIIGSGLKTQDAVFVDLLAEDIHVNGPINTFTRANKNSAQGYDLAPDTGTLSAAQGNLQLITGHTTWAYHSSNITIDNASQTDSASLHINRVILSGNIFIQTTNLISGIEINSNISTIGDISLVDTYQGNSIIPSGNIHLKTFGSLIVKNNTLSTTSNATLEASNISLIPDESYKDKSIEAGNIEISAELTLTMKGLMIADNIKIAANIVNNFGGELFARETLYVNGNGYIKNSHQGLLVGSNVALTSEHSIINGIVEPWSCDVRRSYARSMYIKNDTIQIGSGVGLIKNFINSCNSNSSIRDWTLTERKASIFGFNISLSAPEITNSNPYIKQRKTYKNAEINMEITDSNSVSISAENALVAQAKNSFKNGSGVVEVLNGNMSIDSPTINNQRYYIKGSTHHYTRKIPFTPPKHCPSLAERIDSFINGPDPWMLSVANTFIEQYKRECTSNGSTTENATAQYVSALSPVGRILVAGSVTFNGNKFFNEASNVEIWGKTNGKLNEIKSLGLALNEKIVRKTVTHHSRRYCSRRVLGACIKRKTERWTTTSHKLIKDETTGQFPALFDINKANINVANGKVTTGNITFGK